MEAYSNIAWVAQSVEGKPDADARATDAVQQRDALRDTSRDASETNAMRILIVDDHPIVASGCRAVLADEPAIVLLEACDAESGERAFNTERPDICVIDINLPTVSGFELARRILVRDASARIIMFSMNDDPVFAARAIEIGAKGYVSKTGDPHDLVEAIHEVGKGGEYLPPAMARSIGDIAPAQCRQKSLRGRLARSLLLQDGRQYLLDHASEAWCTDFSRTGPVRDRERRRLKRLMSKP